MYSIIQKIKENQDKMLEIAERINIDKIQLKVNVIKIMNTRLIVSFILINRRKSFCSKILTHIY